jgi:leucyl aminopeptidase (aminopeptidase T)
MMSVPENYSAHLETSTVNGSVNVDFPVTVQGRINKQIALNLGSGGATVRATTTNGGVHLKRVTANE